MAEALDLELTGEPVRLLADRALYWPARERLLIADLHLGKGDTFRAAGIAVPSGGTAHDLARLDALLAQTGARGLWILGDFLHARRNAAVDAAWRAFREAHADVHVAVVPGNHDRAFDAAAAGVERLPEGVRDGPFEFRHAPPALQSGWNGLAAGADLVRRSDPAGRRDVAGKGDAGGSDLVGGSDLGRERLRAQARSHGDRGAITCDVVQGHVICGHVHPVLRLPGTGRHPLFWLRAGLTVLPAFSAFTGGHLVARSDSRGSVLCDGRQLVRLP